MGYIYKITNSINGKVYISKTTRNIESRFYEHKYVAENAESHNGAYPLYQAMRKYGTENFNFEIIEECDDKEIDEKERNYIKLYNSYIGFNKSNGYNATLGGEGAIKYDRQAVYDLWDNGASIKQISSQLKIDRNAVSKIIRGHYPNAEVEIEMRRRQEMRGIGGIGVDQYDENGNLLNHFLSFREAEQKLNIFNVSTAVLTGNKAGGYYWISEESTHTIEDLIKRPRGKELKYKKVAQYGLNNNYITTYNSLKEATAAIKVSHIGDVCNGKRKSAGGYLWKCE